MKKAVLLYGDPGGLLIAALKYIEHRVPVFGHSFEIYGGLVAAIFAGLGIWLGLTMTRTRIVREEVVVVKEVPANPFVRNDSKLLELAITPRELEILQQIAR